MPDRSPIQGALLNSADPQAQGLVCWFPMLEGGGAPADVSPNGHRSTPSNSPAWVSGPDGPALSFNGSTQLLNTDATAPAGPFSISAWVRPHNTGGYVFALGTVGSFIGIRFPGTNTPSYCDGAQDIAAASAVPNNAWSHFVCTADGSTGRLYVNGALAASAASSLSSLTGTLQVGAGNSGSFANVDVSSVRLYSRCLSAADVADIYADQHRPLLQEPAARFFAPASGGGSASAAASVTLGGFTPAASATPGASASASVALGGFTPSASAAPGAGASASVAIGGFTATAAITPGANASASVALGGFTASAAATPGAAGTGASASVTVGGFTATASATPGAVASASVPLGGFVATAAATPAAAGAGASASVALGGFTATASASPGTAAAASVTVGGFTATASASPASSGAGASASVALGGFTATASAAAGTGASASVALGNFTATASAGTPGAVNGLIRRAVCAALKSSPDVAAVVGQKVYPANAPERKALPALTYQLIGRETERNVGGPSGLSRALFQFTALSYDLADCEALAEAVRQLLDGIPRTAYAGVTVVGAIFRGERDLTSPPVAGSDSRVFTTSFDYLIRYREPRPRGQ